jgi:hypothetical protein
LRVAEVEMNWTQFVAFFGNRNAFASSGGAPPRVAGVSRQAVGTEGNGHLVPELLGRDLEVAGIAKVARVLVFVATAQCKRLDVVDHGR